MAPTSNTFLKRNPIMIPIVQRDYVQGAEQWKGKRDAFVSKLLVALHSGKAEPLDFIYGYRDRKGNFVPLDGQQRLTTICLLGWVLIQHELSSKKINNDYRERLIGWMDTLRLKYENRVSSDEFCARLFSEKVNYGTTPLSQRLKDCMWYAERWELDPTVNAMLSMIDAIKSKLDACNYDNVGEMTRRFFEDSPICFEEREIDSEKGADDLYIKINARGKHLTHFEDWKVTFISLLANCHSGKLYKGLTYKDYFELHIESDWCDLLWDYAFSEWDKTESDESGRKRSESYPRIDEYFMRIFHNVTDFICTLTLQGGYLDMKHEKDEETRKAIFTQIYSHGIYVRLLFELLDSAVLIRNWTDNTVSANNAVRNFFESHLYSSTDPKDFDDKKSRINIFKENSGEINLFETLISKGELAARPRLLLLGILRYLHLHNDGEGLNEFLRNWWGMILNTHRQRLKSFEVSSDIRIGEHGREMLRHLDRLLSGKHTDSEKYSEQLLPLLNHPYLLFDLRNLRGALAKRSAAEITERFREFANLHNIEKIRQLVSHGYHGTEVDKRSVTYGLTGAWDYILTEERGSIGKAMESWLTDEAPDTEARPDAVTEFVMKYARLLEQRKHEFAAFMVDGGLQLFGVPQGRSYSKTGYRLEPVAWVTAKAAGVKTDNWFRATMEAASGKMLNLNLFTTDSVHHTIEFADFGLQIESVKTGWRVELFNYDAEALPQSFAGRFGDNIEDLNDSAKQFMIEGNIVADLPGMDRVETGVKLLHAFAGVM